MLRRTRVSTSNARQGSGDVEGRSEGGGHDYIDWVRKALLQDRSRAVVGVVQSTGLGPCNQFAFIAASCLRLRI